MDVAYAVHHPDAEEVRQQACGGVAQVLDQRVEPGFRDQSAINLGSILAKLANRCEKEVNIFWLPYGFCLSSLSPTKLLDMLTP